MEAGKRGTLAVAAALGLACLVTAPAAIAAQPAARSHAVKPSRHPTHTIKAKSPTAKPTTAKPSTSAPPPSPAYTCQPQLSAAALNAVPWAQQRLDFQSVWPATRGNGVKVAVVDSGVDTKHVQLAGRVVQSIDLTHTVTRDCYGHGTAVAGIIAAQDMRDQNLPFTGVAPGAHIVSVKFTNQERTAAGSDPLLAKAIIRAADSGAQVINVSVQGPAYPKLEEAIRYAQSRDAVVVAAAGNVQGSEQGAVGAAYPAQYPGVLSVGSLSPDGTLAASSNTASRVDVSAPGKGVDTLWPGGYAPAQEGTSFACAFVSGLAALVRAYHPKLGYRQVEQRIIATADGASGSGAGAGMINPQQAVTALLPGQDGPANSTAPQPGARQIKVAYRRPPDSGTQSSAALLAGGALLAAVLVVIGGVLVPMGRKRGWRPGRRTATPTDED